MSELISRQAAIEYLMVNMNWYDEDGCESDEDYKHECITELINGVPTAEKMGKWSIEDCHAATYKYCCSECKAHHRARYDYCPTCGARMEESE